jgi:catechol 2,3-dioxygenase-like lactoylglutathione lyase family enzyme
VFDHVTITVSNVPASKRFYSTVLGVLGMEPGFSDNDAMGWDDWWIGS